MQVTIKGLKNIDTEKAEQIIAQHEEGDILAYGVSITDSLEDHAVYENNVVNELVRTLLVTQFDHALNAYGKMYVAHTEADLTPELENMDFGILGNIYVARRA